MLTRRLDYPGMDVNELTSDLDGLQDRDRQFPNYVASAMSTVIFIVIKARDRVIGFRQTRTLEEL